MKPSPPNLAFPRPALRCRAGLSAFLLRCLLLACLPAGTGSAAAATFYHTVSNTFDYEGFGSLRTAINAINAVPAGSTDTHIISFDLGNVLGAVKTIQVLSALPIIERDCIIDGTTADGYINSPLVELDGIASWNSSQNESLQSSGLEIRNCKVTIKALAINRFWEDGVHCSGGELKLLGCRIGTNAAGTVARPNLRHGVYVEDWNPGTVNSAIGDTSSNGRNIISGNKRHGLVISSAGGSSGELVVENNLVGTDVTGLAALPNGEDGIAVLVGSGRRTVRIGRAGAGRNILSGNTRSGFSKYHFTGSSGDGETYVRNNLIGLGVNGTTVVPNGRYGVLVDNQKVTIGGTASSDGNTISGNTWSGVRVVYYGGSAFDQNKTAALLGNQIGTALDGLAARPNGGFGIFVDGTAGQTRIGTATTGNVIAGNGAAGVKVDRGGATLLRNLIGLNKNVQPLGNGAAGIEIADGSYVLAGNSTVSGSNIIGGNNGPGISVSSGSSAKIAGNYIGLTATGADVGNSGAGLEVFWDDGLSSYGIEIGGTGAGAGNFIAFNNSAGVRVTETSGQGAAFCSILGNSIRDNTGPGIDLGPAGVTPNDGQDPDTGANARQNFPVITSATVTKIFGSLNSKPNNTYRIELFTAQAHASGYGNGRTYLGATTAYTDATGNAQWAKNGLSLTSGQLLTATATLLGPGPVQFDHSQDIILQDTSEFCLNKTVSSPDFPDVNIALSAATYTGDETGGVIQIPVIRSGLTNAVVTMKYQTLDGTALAGQDYTAVNGTLTFQSGVTQLFISIPVSNDHTYELNETFRVQLLNPGPGVIPGAITEAVVTIPDTAGPPVISITSYASIPEGHSGDTLLPIQVTLSTAALYTTNITCRINTDVIDSGTASSPSDYQGGFVQLSFAPGETQKSFNLIIHGDMAAEPSETVIIKIIYVSISGGWEIFSYDSPVIGSANTCYATIINDDDASPGMMQFSSAVYTVAENTGTATITVNRVNGTGGAASVNYVVAGGTATAGSDYLASSTSGTLNFAHGQSSATFTVTLVNDYVAEGPETIQFQLQGLTGSTPGVTTATTLTVTDNDAPGSLQFSALSTFVSENSGSVTITVTRASGTDGAASVNYARIGGTATAGTDFIAATTSGTLNFAHGQASASFTMVLLDDFVVEGPETIILQLSNATGATLGSLATTTLTLADNETGTTISGRVAAADGSGIEGTTVTLTGSQNASMITDITGNYNFVGVVTGLNYAVVVTAPGWSFSPDTRSYSNLGGPQPDQDFLGMPEVLPELRLSLLPSGSVFLDWPISGWTLMSSTTMAANSWTPVTAIITQRGGYNQVTLPGSERTFFRLDRPTGGGGGAEDM